MSKEDLTKTFNDTDKVADQAPKQEIGQEQIEETAAKYNNDAGELAKAKTYADDFINTLKEENARLRDAQSQRDAEMERLREAAVSNVQKTAVKEETPTTNVPVSENAVSEDEVAERVRQEIQRAKDADQVDANAAKTMNLLNEAYGEANVTDAIDKLTKGDTDLKDKWMAIALTDPEGFVESMKARVPVDTMKVNTPGINNAPVGTDKPTINLSVTMTDMKKVLKEQGTDAYLERMLSPDVREAQEKCEAAGIDFNLT